MATKRRSDHLREEAAFLPRSLEDLAELRRRIRAAGHPDQVASGIAGWLVDKAADDPDRTSAPTRSRYRKILAELEPLHSPDPDGDRRPLEVVGGPRPDGRRQRGHGVRKALVALAVAGAGVIGAGGHHRDPGQVAGTWAEVPERPELRGSVKSRRRRGRGGLRRAA